MKEYNIFTIIVTYNAMKWLDRCLNSLRASSIPTTVVVIDNGSTDNTIASIQTHFPEVVLFPQDKNLGFGQANNIGMRYALAHGASHVLLLNQDAWIEERMLETLLRYDDNNSLLSPIHMTGEGDRFDTNFEKNAIRRSQEYERFKQDQIQGKNAKYATYEINAACWLLPRLILEEIGGFNPLFFHYAEDTDYLQRLHYHHKGVYFVSGTYCYHDRANIPAKLPTKQLIYQQMILRAVDINYSTIVCMLRRLRYGLAVWHTAFAEHRFEDIKLYYQAKIAYFKKAKEIPFNRHQIEAIGAHWLR